MPYRGRPQVPRGFIRPATDTQPPHGGGPNGAYVRIVNQTRPCDSTITSFLKVRLAGSAAGPPDRARRVNLNRVGETGTGSTHHGAAHPRTPWRVRRLSCSALYRHPERHGRPCRRPTFRGALASQIISDARRTRNAQVCERLGGATATAPRLQRPGRSGRSLATADRGPAVVRSARAVRTRECCTRDERRERR